LADVKMQGIAHFNHRDEESSWTKWQIMPLYGERRSGWQACGLRRFVLLQE